jgi:hypothetical protein
MRKVCSWCGRIETSRGWYPIDLSSPPTEPISHGICPACHTRSLRDQLEREARQARRDLEEARSGVERILAIDRLSKLGRELAELRDEERR